MTAFAIALLVLAAALLVDRVAGDPPTLWSRVAHPVALAGRIVGLLDRHLNRPELERSTLRLLGVAVIAGLALVACGIGLALHVALARSAIGLAVEVLIVSVLLAQKSLIDHVEAVGRALLSGGVTEGQRAVARIVGRDVTSLNEDGIARAAMESAAENFSDGVVAPVFWFVIAGLPGLFIYKLANTADSMIGYRDTRHAAFGWATARFDDLMNVVPARLSALLIAAAAALCGYEARQATAAAWHDAPKHKSPNAGWPEAALAGALGVAFGGPRRYGTVEVDGAWLNAEGRRAADPEDILSAIRLIDVAWTLVVVLVAGAALILLASAR